MRIAVITSSYPTTSEDPSGHFVRAEVRALIEAGHEVSVFLPRARGPRSESEPRLYELPHLGLFGWPGALERLRRSPWLIAGLIPFSLAARRRLAQKGRFEKIVAHWIVPAFWPISRDFDQETLVVAHGSDVRLLERLPTLLQQRIIQGLARTNVTIRCVSTDLAERLRVLGGGRYAERLTIAVEPVTIEIPSLPSRSALKRELGLTAGPIVIVVGRAVKDKRIDLAVQAVEAAIAAAGLTNQASLIVIGDGPERAAWMRRFPKVHWLGQLGRSDTLRHIRAADLLVSASLREGAPTAIREARALGTRVIAAKAGDLVDWATRDRDLSVVEQFSTESRGPTCRLITQQLLRCHSVHDENEQHVTPNGALAS